MGLVTMGIFALNVEGIEGALIQMLSHGVVSAALFLCVGVVYDRVHSRLIARYGGLVHRMPAYAAVLMVFTLAAIGVPGTSGFVGEFLTLVGAFLVSKPVAAFAATGMILGVAYMLWMYRRVIFGALVREDLKKITDLNLREVAVFAPLIAIVIWMGVYPSSFLDVFHVSVDHLLKTYEMAQAAPHGTVVAADLTRPLEMLKGSAGP
jgi:NADH-quinone oxidoreductase subunit M